MTLYEKTIDLCKKSNISIARLEKEIGLSSGSINKWKTNSPSVKAVGAVASFFGISTDYLLGKEELDYYIDPETKRIAQEIYDNPDLRMLFHASRKATPDDMKKVIEMTKIMLGGIGDEAT